MMYNVVKNTIIGWWVGVLAALMLFYRGDKYDWILGVVLLVFGLISLFNYGVYNHATPTEVGVAIASAIALAAFLPLLAFLSIKSQSTLVAFFLLVLIVLILFSFFYGLGYSSEYSMAKKEIQYYGYGGDGTFISPAIIMALMIVALVGFALLCIYGTNSQFEMLKLGLYLIATLVLLYIGYDSFWISRIYYIIVIFAAAALLL